MQQVSEIGPGLGLVGIWSEEECDACQTVFAEFRQLDFSLGDWTVSAEQGGELGTSEIRSDLNGCLTQEHFATPKGYRSRSYLYFDFVVERWFRTFADNTGMHIS